MQVCCKIFTGVALQSMAYDAHCEQGWCRERARQARANKLSHAVEALDVSDKESIPKEEGRPLYCMLQPAEEALVERLLAQVSARGSVPCDKQHSILATNCKMKQMGHLLDMCCRQQTVSVSAAKRDVYESTTC